MEIVDFSKDYNKGRVFLFFEGEDCGLCQGMKAKSLEFLKDQDAKFMSVKLSDYPKLRGEFQVFSFPTLLYLKDGVEIERMAGFFNFEKFFKILDREF